MLRKTVTLAAVLALVSSRADAQNHPFSWTFVESIAGRVCEYTSVQMPTATTQANCALPGSATGLAYSSATLGGNLKASSEINFGSPTGQILLAPGERLLAEGFAAYSNRLKITPLNVGGAAPKTVTLWMNLDGTTSGSRGLISEPDAEFFADWVLNLITPAEGYQSFRGDSRCRLDASPDVVVAYKAYVCTSFGLFSNIAVGLGYTGRSVTAEGFGSGYVDFDWVLSARTFINNMGLGLIDVIGQNAFMRSDFENTAFLTGVQAFDDFGNDITADFRFSLASGQQVPGGNGSVVPEPSTWAMMSVGLLLVGFVSRRSLKFK